MRVEKPRFDEFGDVAKCADCPWEKLYEGLLCPHTCPTNRNYDQQCRLAEQVEKGVKE